MELRGITYRSAFIDIFTGIIIALVSIPISMGYAQVSGLPPVYGLYGSIFPILIFGFLSSSKQFIFGVDAAPAALIGAFVASRGIESGSEEAVRFVPMLTILVACWLLIFRIFRAGKLVTYISTPVMGGFISGISTTIIFMQIPKILGGTSGRGEIAELIKHIVVTCRESFSLASTLLGGSALAVLLVLRKVSPRFPASIFVMAAGAILGVTGFAERHGAATLSAIDTGLPVWKFPEFEMSYFTGSITTSLTVAVVIMAETLLASNNYANKNGYKINNNREILVYALGNAAAGLTGCCPVNGSVSRTAMGEQYGGRSQIMSITASVSMALILMFGTGFIQYLPVSVLTAIVISALLGAVEIHLAKRLYRQDRKELFIFIGSFLGVLVFGTVYGVMIGVVLSFATVILRTADPKRSFLGVINGHEGFHSLERNSYAVPLKEAVIYRFSGNLYFANINIFIKDVEDSIKKDTKCVIIDSGAICNIDITSADMIKSLRRILERSGIELYFASHIGTLNDRFRQLGLADMVEDGYCRRTIPSALLSAGIKPPYETEMQPRKSAANRLEFEWAFGSMADEEIEKYTQRLLKKINTSNGDPQQMLNRVLGEGKEWHGISELDQAELLMHIGAHIRDIAEKFNMNERQIEEAVELRKLLIAQEIETKQPEVFKLIREHTRRFEEELHEKDPELYERLLSIRREALNGLRKSTPEYGRLIDSLYDKDETGAENDNKESYRE